MELGMSQTETVDGTSPQTLQPCYNVWITTFSIPRDQLCVPTFVDTVCNSAPTGTVALLSRKVGIAFSLNFKYV